MQGPPHARGTWRRDPWAGVTPACAGCPGQVIRGDGTTTAGLAHAYAEAFTVGLRHGVPLSELVRQGRDLHFVPHGATTDPQIPRARSAVDWVARRLDLDWAPDQQQAPPGTAERPDQARTRPPREHAALPQPSPDELTVFWDGLATGIGTPSAR